MRNLEIYMDIERIFLLKIIFFFFDLMDFYRLRYIPNLIIYIYILFIFLLCI